MFVVDALSEIASQLGKKDWNFSLNPCDELQLVNTKNTRYICGLIKFTHLP